MALSGIELEFNPFYSQADFRGQLGTVPLEPSLGGWFSAAYNIWKVMNRREPEGLGYTAYAYPNHPDRITHIPRTCKSRFRPVRAKVQVDKWVADMNRLFPNCPYFQITCTVLS